MRAGRRAVSLRQLSFLLQVQVAVPLAPEHLYIDDDMLSDTLRWMMDETNTAHVPCTKLASSLRDKTRYVTYHRCLQFT